MLACGDASSRRALACLVPLFLTSYVAWILRMQDDRQRLRLVVPSSFDADTRADRVLAGDDVGPAWLRFFRGASTALERRGKLRESDAALLGMRSLEEATRSWTASRSSLRSVTPSAGESVHQTCLASRRAPQPS